MLVVMSNFAHLKSALMPGMLNQLQSALGTPINEDKQAGIPFLCLAFG